PIKNQGGRGTCTYFAATAALEAAYKKEGHGTLDLSEQHLVWLRDVTSLTDDSTTNKLPLNNAHLTEDLLGSLSGGSAVYNLQLLTDYGMGSETEDPYIGDASYEEYTSSYYKGSGLEHYDWSNRKFPQEPLNKWNMASAQFPEAVRTGTHYGVANYISLSQSDYQDPRCIEWLIAHGYSVAIGMTLYQNDYGTPARPIWTKDPKNTTVDGGHAVLIVGYDRRRHFFVFKNSWGPIHYDAGKLDRNLKDVAVKYDNYYLLDYNYLPAVDEAGFIVNVTKPNAERFANEPMLGAWKMQVMEKGSKKPVFTGTLTWRHLPKTDVYMADKDARIGDLQGKEDKAGAKNKLYRVNGDLGKTLTFYIDFEHPATHPTDTTGLRFTGHLEKSRGKMEITGEVSGEGSDTTLFGEPVKELSFSLEHE
ncbi:MAG TPA: C1 family peptidase, partial [Chthonomonadaceae bacterium]|nr:C1 family peptidase [Chthonomonadaceae bacterium]